MVQTESEWAGQQGALLVLLAVALVALMTIAALAVDVGVAYSQRRQNSSIADMVALAAARYLPGDPGAACPAGWNYLKANLRPLPGGASSPCTGFPSTCDPTSTATDYPVMGASPYTITFRYPVPDGDPLLGSARAQDGTNECERFGVTVTRVDGSYFAGAFGGGVLSPSASAVARHSVGTKLQNVANLVVLDPTGCVGIDVQGAGTSVLVGTSTKPGAIGVDSDGTACTGGSTTVRAPNTGARLWAQPTSGSTPGQILLYALPGSQTACTGTACSPADVSGGHISPQPLSAPARITRAVVDYAYNCKASYAPLYAGVVQIPGCDTGNAPNIDNLVAEVSAHSATSLPSGYTKLSGTDCSPSASPAPGNYWVDCRDYKVTAGNIAFTGGNVIFTGDVSLSAGATLSFNTANTNSYTSCSPLCLDSSSAGAAFVYVDGHISATGANLNFQHAFVYITPGISGSSSNFGCATNAGQNYTSESGTGASVNWVAPTEGPFKNLALWSEAYSNKFQLTGGGAGAIDGVFFTPCANPFSISGGFTNPQTAQFLSFQLAVTGGATLAMTPDPNRLLLTAPSGSLLIR